MTTVQASFGRRVNLKVYSRQVSFGSDGQPMISQTDFVGTNFPSQLPDGTPAFRIKAKVDKIASVLSTTPTPVGIEIYNVNEHSRAILNQLNALIVLEAGYGNSVHQLFKGSVNFARTHKEGPDYITHIEAMTGLFAFQNSRVNMNAVGIPTNGIINTLVGLLSGSGITPGVIQGLPNTATYNQGIVLSGKTVDMLKSVCEKHDLHLFFQDEKVFIIPYGSDIQAPIVFLSEDTGLIGIPEVRSQGLPPPGAQTPSQIISFKSLLLPQLNLFQVVSLTSKFVNGNYSVARIVHNIDSWEGPFFTEVECSSR